MILVMIMTIAIQMKRKTATNGDGRVEFVPSIFNFVLPTAVKIFQL